MTITECRTFEQRSNALACALRWTVEGESLAAVVAGNLVRLRLDREWTQVELGRRLAPLVGRVVTQAQVSTWETMRSVVSVDMVAVLATVLECQLIELFRLPDGSALPVIVADDADLVSRTDVELIAELHRRLARRPPNSTSRLPRTRRSGSVGAQLRRL
jgi:transcriptional regulator with XRE-family HTH domain